MKNIVVFTGSGISAESGIPTFRGATGLWNNMRIEDVCTPEALVTNRPQLIEFYNNRRHQIYNCQPNAGHLAIARLEQKYHVEVITQNIDNLHERAGSTNITHLHGDITLLCSSRNPEATIPCQGEMQPLDARHPDGSLLRPHIVFFGEPVPMMDHAILLTQLADLFIVVGTSLSVYPAASLLHFVKPEVPIYLIDPATPDISAYGNRITHICQNATVGVPQLVEQLLKQQ